MIENIRYQCIKQKWTMLLAMSTFVFLISCNSNVVYKGNYPIESQQLTYTDSVEFAFDIEDTTSTYDLVLGITYDEVEFAYENLYTTINTYFPNGTIINDLVSFDFRTDSAIENTICKSGKCTIPIYLQTGIGFNQVGNYRISFIQNSRDSILRGLHNFDFEVVIAE